MKKTLTLLTFLVLVISCDYKSPEKDRHPEIPVFSGQVLQNPEKYGLVQINEKNEDIQNLFIDNERLILISEVGEAGISPDSLVISEYKNLSEVKKIYYKTGQDSSNPISIRIRSIIWMEISTAAFIVFPRLITSPLFWILFP